MNKDESVIVIGAGLSGLYAAWRLHQNGVNVQVLEARDRIGGRILSQQPMDDKPGRVDMGPAWVWPAFQPLLHALLNELGVSVFAQHTQGDMLYEVDAHNIQRHGGPSSHNQSYRISGGAVALVDALYARLPEPMVQLNTVVNSVDQHAMTVMAEQHGETRTITADRIILALPPRLTAANIRFEPSLDQAVINTWNSLPTWMASHSKMVFIYEQPFWREQGLSGEVFSRYGPLTEIYDGSPEDESFYALTSFVGLNAAQRRQATQQQLTNAAMTQLERLFGQEARSVQSVLMSDWSEEPFTTTELDLQGIPHHPQLPDNVPRGFWNNRLLLAGTEVAREHGGYLEGAIESANAALSMLK